MRVQFLALVFLTLLACPPALAETDEPGPTPQAPTLNVGKDTANDEVHLTWSGTTSPYAVVRDTDPDFNDLTPEIVVSGLVSTTFDDPVLGDGVDYYYLVRDDNSRTTIYGTSTDTAVPGQSITLEGIGFGSALGDNLVVNAGEQAIVTGVTETTLTFEIPTTWSTGTVIVVTPKGANIAGRTYQVGAQGLSSISSVAIDSVGTKYVTDTGTGGTSDKVFSFDPVMMSRTEVGLLNEATGLPADAVDRVYYGNAIVNPFNQGTIERTKLGGTEEFYRACGQAVSNPCYVFGIALDPDITNPDAHGRVYVADGARNAVRLVPLVGLIQDFATGFDFGNPPRGIVVDRDPASMFYHDVYVSDSTQVYRYDSATVPGTLVRTYDPEAFPFVSPRQMALTPTNRVRLLVADSGQGRIVMLNPETEASKVINVPLNSPRAIATEHDPINNKDTAWVGEPDRVLKLPVHRTVYLSIWVAEGAGISDVRVRELVSLANASISQCGIELQIRDDLVNTFVAGDLLDLEANDATGTSGCGDPAFVRTQEEIDLLGEPLRRSSEPTDLNVYFVRRFTYTPTAQKRVGEAIFGDCFVGVSDETESGIILSAESQAHPDTIWALGHEIGHALLDRNTWTPGMNTHFPRSGFPNTLPPGNIMARAADPGKALFNDPDQCLNINADNTIFRGDP